VSTLEATGASAGRALEAPPPLPRGLERIRTLFRLWRREKFDPGPFYLLLAAELAEDFDRRHGPLAGQTLLDLGCGPGFYTRALRARGATVIPVDNDPAAVEWEGTPVEGALLADGGHLPLADASVDGVVCSNLLEHTPDPEAVLREVGRVLRPGGWAYVSWTNWYSPWGGHEFNPFQYLGPRLGPRLWERLFGPVRKNAYGEGLWAAHIGPILRFVRRMPELRVDRVEPRYWPQLRFICRVPLVREVLTWNCVIRATRAAGD
jgi:SAM-dependent methyltransferase